MNENTERKCAYCGSTDASVAQHGGIDECRNCWNYRKLDGPAAKHWFKASAMFLSNIDMHDAMTFMPQRVGVTAEEFGVAVEVANKIYEASKAMLLEHNEIMSEDTLKEVVRDTYHAMQNVQYFIGHDAEGNAVPRSQLVDEVVNPDSIGAGYPEESQ